MSDQEIYIETPPSVSSKPSSLVVRNERVAYGRAPYGWKYNHARTKFIHDEAQQQNIELVKTLRRNNRSWTFIAISNRMNSDGIAARIVLDKEGKIVKTTKFNPSLIQSILSDAHLI
jgi:hypothetical protein